MADQVYVFCLEDPPPTFKELLDFLSEEGFDIKRYDEDENSSDDEEDSEENLGWAEATLIYNHDREPLVVECRTAENSDEFDELRDELQENLEARKGGGRERVSNHLRRSSFYIGIALPSDQDEEAQAIQNALVHHLTNEYKGLAYVEDEGYYSAEDTLVLDLS
ncbi:MAG: hypothetical protein C4523_07795 [Myxococcales bacterium]|nr:MAG: hypothetical protein C4523_07795 [Myxococcales bacterium]